MEAYSITYKVKGKDQIKSIIIDAKDMKSAKKKIGKKNGYADGRMIEIQDYSVIGYF